MEEKTTNHRITEEELKELKAFHMLQDTYAELPVPHGFLKGVLDDPVEGTRYSELKSSKEAYYLYMLRGGCLVKMMEVL